MKYLVKYLVKYMSISVSLLFAIWVLSVIDINFKKLHFGSDGITIEKQRKVVNQFGQINERLKRLENKVFPTDDKNLTDTIEKIGESIADLGKISDYKTIYQGVIGYVWIGDYNHKEKIWVKKSLYANNKIEPNSMIMKKFVTKKSLYIRKEMPKNTKNYYKNIAIVGIVPKKIKIKVLDKPVGVDRGFAIQYWAKIKVLE